MFVNGIASKFNLVRQMQLGGDLQNAWMMFDHIKFVQGWMTMAYHVNDQVYCKVMMLRFVTYNPRTQRSMHSMEEAKHNC